MEGIEISGSEEFVSAQIDSFKELIISTYDKILEKSEVLPLPERYNDNREMRLLNIPSLSTKETTDADFEEVKTLRSGISYENVIVFHEDKIQIIADIPGDSKARQMINTILLYLWAKLQKGIDSCSYSELRDYCQYLGVLDPTNFSKHIEKSKKFFLVGGDSRNKTVRLIHPCIKEAEKLIIELNKK